MQRKTADVCDAHGAAARVIPGIGLRFGGAQSFAGPAFPVQLYGPDGALADVLKSAGAGRVAIVAVDHPDAKAVFGEGMARDAETNGWAGVIVAGAVRDVETFAGRTVGIAASATHPAIIRDGETGGAVSHVTIEGVTVTADDTVVCDADGVVAIATTLLV